MHLITLERIQQQQKQQRRLLAMLQYWPTSLGTHIDCDYRLRRSQWHGMAPRFMVLVDDQSSFRISLVFFIRLFFSIPLLLLIFPLVSSPHVIRGDFFFRSSCSCSVSSLSIFINRLHFFSSALNSASSKQRMLECDWPNGRTSCTEQSLQSPTTLRFSAIWLCKRPHRHRDW